MPDPRRGEGPVLDWLAEHEDLRGARQLRADILAALSDPPAPKQRATSAAVAETTSGYADADSPLANACRSLGMSEEGYLDAAANASKTVSVMDAWRRHLENELRHKRLVDRQVLDDLAWDIDYAVATDWTPQCAQIISERLRTDYQATLESVGMCSAIIRDALNALVEKHDLQS